jgi:hypothetical protein
MLHALSAEPHLQRLGVWQWQVGVQNLLESSGIHTFFSVTYSEKIK